MLAQQDLREHKARQGHKVQLVQRVQLDLLERLVCKAQPGQPDLLVLG